MKQLFLICVSLLFSVSSLAAQEGRFVQKDNIFPRVEIVTSLGSIVVELDRSRAPITVNNFLTSLGYSIKIVNTFSEWDIKYRIAVPD